MWLSIIGSQAHLVHHLHSFIPAISIAPLRVLYYSEALPTQHGYCIGVSRRSAQATAGKGLAQGPYVAARAGVEPTTFRLKVIVSSKAPPRGDPTKGLAPATVPSSMRHITRSNSDDITLLIIPTWSCWIGFLVDDSRRHHRRYVQRPVGKSYDHKSSAKEMTTVMYKRDK